MGSDSPSPGSSSGGASRISVDAGTIEMFLSSTALFAKCDPTILPKIAPRIEAYEFPARSTIMPAGQPAAGIGIVFRGKALIRVVDAMTGQTASEDVLRMGDHFGDVAALLGTAQPFAVVADEATTILRFPPDLVEQLFTKVGPFTHAIARKLATRVVQTTTQALRPRPSLDQIKVGPVAAQSLPAPAPQTPAGIIPFVQVGDYDVQRKTVSMVPVKLLQQYQLLPLVLRGNVLTVGMVHPRNTNVVSQLQRLLHSVQIEIVAISLEDFSQTFVRLNLDGGAVASDARKNPAAIAPSSLVFDSVELDDKQAVRVIGDEVILLVNRIIAAALDRDASDIHIEPDATGMRVRFRVHGAMSEWGELISTSLAKPLVARLKVIAGLDITDRRLPQDGRIGLRVGRKEIDLRVSTLPSNRGETVVMRVFEAGSTMRPLDQIFVDPATLAAVRRSLDRPYGAVIVAGPTGSGKSSTLYATLNERRKTRPDSKILMIEDPIEYRLPGVVQVQINQSTGLGFAEVLRAALRQDPDVIMVGEIRDSETAKTALEAAMTGHLLFTSIHANNAVSVLERLENLGCGRTLIAQSLAIVLVQRLARRLCPHCTKVEPAASVMVETLAAHGLSEKGASANLPRAVGCDACKQTGFLGRVAVVEALQLNESLKGVLMGGATLSDFQKTAIEAGALSTTARAAAQLMAKQVLAPSEALLVVAD